MKKFRLLALLFPVVCAAQNGSNHVTILSTDTEKDIIRKAANVTPSPRQLRWQQLEITAFFHFGINTFTNKEWGDGKEDISLFNPTELDAKQWVKTAKEAGINQVIITAKHHDGFCLWPSQYTKHSIQYTPWKNGKGDIVKEVAEACHLYNIGFGVYLSPWDRNSAYYGDSAKYNAYFMNQLTELLSNYGKVDEVWFDGANGEGPNGKKQVYNFGDWYKLIRKLQPSAVIAVMGPDVRWVGTESGVGRTTEWSVVPADQRLQDKIASGSQKDVTFVPNGDMMDTVLGSREKLMTAKGLIWYPAETDVSIRPGWFYHPAEDTAVKSPQTLTDIYFSSVGRNSLLLLNIPPDTRGLLSNNDSLHLLQWKEMLDKTFVDNKAAKAVANCDNGVHTSALLDNNNNTFFTTKGGDTTATINFTLSKSQTFNVLLLQEHIQTGQRIESFRLEYWDETTNNWKEATKGTTVGYKRLLRFDEVTTKKVRLVIESSRLNPTLNEFGLYKMSL